MTGTGEKKGKKHGWFNGLPYLESVSIGDIMVSIFRKHMFPEMSLDLCFSSQCSVLVRCPLNVISRTCFRRS